MAKSPTYTVIVEKTNQNITELISSLEYEDCLNEDDLITLTISGAEMDVIDKDYFNVGQRLIFTFGFIQGLQSPKRHCEITEIEIHYVKKKVEISVKGRDLGYVAKKITSNYVYKNKTASQIASDVADKFGLGKEIDNTTKVYDYLPMANKNFMHFLKDLASKEGVENSSDKGHIEVYVRGNILYFKNRDFGKNSRRTFTYGDPESLIESVSLTYEDEKDNAAESVSSSGVDTKTGKPYKSEAKASENKETAVGDNALNYDVDSNYLSGGLSSVSSTLSGKKTYTPGNNKAEVDSKVGDAHKKKTAKILKLDLTIELDPTIDAGDIITMAGLAQKHSGNWRIEKVIHTVNGSPAVTKIEAYKNGTKKAVTTGTTKNTGSKNNTTGSNTGSTTKKIYRYNENSIEKK